MATQSAVARAATPEPIRRRVLGLAWPAIVEMTLGMMVGMIDTAMVGRLGAVALTSVGLGAQVIFIAQTLFSAITTGTTALVARHIGAQEQERAEQVARQSLVLGGLMAGAASLTLIALGPSLVRLLYGSSEPAVQANASMYVRIVAAAMPFNFLLIVMNGVLRGAGDTKTPMMVMTIVNATNVICNYGLIYGGFGLPRWGIKGAAVATAVAQVSGGCLVALLLFGGRAVIRLSVHDGYSFDWGTVRRVLVIGVPAGVEQVLMRFGQVTYSVIIASLGTVAYAAHQIALNAESLSFMPGFGFALAATSLVGQSLGARDPEGAHRAGMEAARLAAMIMSGMGLVLFLIPGPIVSIFTHDAAVVAQSARVLRIVAVSQPALALVMVLAGGLRGAGDTRTIMVITGLGFCGVRIAVAYLLVRAGYGLVGAWIGMVVDLFFRGTLYLWRFQKGGWQRIEV